MGGLFSSNQPERSRNENREYRVTSGGNANYYNSSYRPAIEKPRSSVYCNSYNNQVQNLSSNHYAAMKTRRITPPERSQIKTHLFSQEAFLNSHTTTYIVLNDYNPEIHIVRRLITNKKNFKVDRISKIENPLLSMAYNLKKEQQQIYCPNVEERLLFHGTSWTNVDSICDMNFNWRKCKTHEYGAGVSFSPNCNYAANYSDEGIRDKVMILAKVLVGHSCIGNPEMKLPLDGCDTSQKGQDGIVIVKYDDNEFLPLFKIEYHLIIENKRKYKNHNAKIRRSRQSMPPWQVQNYDDFAY